VKVTDPPTHAVCGVGWPVIATGVLIDRVAAALVALPHVPVTTQSYEPASPAETDGIVYTELVAPPIVPPPLRHW
jgi:hypothetical protein